MTPLGLSRGCGSAGRTLVELVVAASATLLILLAVTSLLGSGLRWAGADRAVIRQQRAVRNAADRIARDLRQADAVAWTGDLEVTRGGATHRYRLTEQRLELVAADGAVSLTFQPISHFSAAVNPATGAVSVSVGNRYVSGLGYRVDQIITPRTVMP